MKKQKIMIVLLIIVSLSCSFTAHAEKHAHDAPVNMLHGDAEKKEPMHKALQDAVKAQDVFKVQSFLKDDAHVHARDEEGKTVLMFAAQNGHQEIIQLLLHAGAAINATDSSNNTALFYAIGGGHVDAARLLLQQGAHVNAVNHLGRTPLMDAAALWYEDMVPMLLQYNPARHAKDADGKTAFMHACEHGRLRAVELLFDANIAVNGQDKEGKTALYLAAEGYIFGYHHHGPSVGEQTEVVAFLLKHKADHTIRDNKGVSVVDLVNTIPHNHMIDVLQEHGVYEGGR